MIDTALILAGGFGTRLRSVVENVPKPLAPVGETPFLFYCLEQAKVSKDLYISIESIG